MSGTSDVWVISGPSAVGKGTVCARLRELHPDLFYSVSLTTRPPRPGEVDGVSYHFIGVDDNALCILRMNGGAVGTLAASWTVYGKECNSTCLYGTKGIMLIHSDPGAPIVVRDMSNTSTAYSFEPTTRSGVIDEFVDALEHDREPEIDGKKALTIMSTVFASIKSSEISRTVAVNSSFVSHL